MDPFANVCFVTADTISVDWVLGILAWAPGSAVDAECRDLFDR